MHVLCFSGLGEKFGESFEKPKTNSIQTPRALYSLIQDDLLIIKSTRIISEEVMEIVTANVDEEDVPSTKTNIFIACFTTSHARLKLYESLYILGKQVLYYDTDSVIFKWREGLADIPTGNFLGQMTDETEGDPILEFASGGAKNYAYRTRGGKYECKVRGFTLNVRGPKIVNLPPYVKIL